MDLEAWCETQNFDCEYWQSDDSLQIKGIEICSRMDMLVYQEQEIVVVRLPPMKMELEAIVLKTLENFSNKEIEIERIPYFTKFLINCKPFLVPDIIYSISLLEVCPLQERFKSGLIYIAGLPEFNLGLLSKADCNFLSSFDNFGYLNARVGGTYIYLYYGLPSAEQDRLFNLLSNLDENKVNYRIS